MMMKNSPTVGFLYEENYTKEDSYGEVEGAGLGFRAVVSLCHTVLTSQLYKHGNALVAGQLKSHCFRSTCV